jgi:hypothetical protein
MQEMDSFKMIVIAINSGKTYNKMCKNLKFGFAKSADLFSYLELLNKVSCNKIFWSVNKISQDIKRLVKTGKSVIDNSHEDGHARLYTSRHTLLNVRYKMKVMFPKNIRFFVVSKRMRTSH